MFCKNTIETMLGTRVTLFPVVIILADCFSTINGQNSNSNNVETIYNNTFKLVHKIRRQLMKDNYDYSSSVEEATTTIKNELHTAHARSAKLVSVQEDEYTSGFNDIAKQQVQQNKYSDRIDKSHDQQYQNSEHSNIFTDNTDYDKEEPPKRQSKFPEYFDFKTDDGNDYTSHLHKVPTKNENIVNNPPDHLLFPVLTNVSPNHGFKHLSDPNASNHRDKNRYPKIRESYPDSSHITVPQLYKQVSHEVGAIRWNPGNSRNSNAPITDRGFSISSQDLLYYMDDKRMMRNGGMNENLMESPSSIETDNYLNDVTNSATSKAKYRVIRVKDADPSRRKMSYRRFVEERDSEGVSLFQLDSGPFPQFRLPRARRQYMHGNEDGLAGNDTIDTEDI